MVRRPGDGARFLSTTNTVGPNYSITQIVRWVLVMIVVVPFLYHLLIKRNLIEIIMRFLHYEFGCDCSQCTPKVKNEERKGYF